MKNIYKLFVLNILSLQILYSQVGTYTFSSASIVGQSVRETVGGVLLTVTFNGGGDPGIEGYNGWGGVSGNSVYNNIEASSMTLTFNSTVTIASLRLADGVGGTTQNFILTPSPSGSPATATVPADGGVNKSLGSSFNNITSIVITPQSGGMTYYILDDVVLQSILPVELTSFTTLVKNNFVVLNWQTKMEVNNYGFEIEKSEVSSQKSEWKTIGFVNGNGNSNSPKEYSYNDVNLKAGNYQYRLKQIDNDGQFKYSKEVEVSVENFPIEFALEQNYPNPFNPVTTIEFTVPKSAQVNLSVYNVLGEVVAVLEDKYLEAGNYEVEFNASHLASGIYIYTLMSDGKAITKMMNLIK